MDKLWYNVRFYSIVTVQCFYYVSWIVLITLCIQLLFDIMARRLQIKINLLANSGFLNRV